MPELTIEAAMIEMNRLKTTERMDIDRDRMTAAIDVLKDAAQFRIKRKPINPTYGNIKCDCPNCFSSVYYATDLFCRKCGQALDWATFEANQ